MYNESMTTMQITLQDDLKARLAQRAAESGFANVEQYVESLLRLDAEEQVIPDEQLEELLLQRLDSGPGVEMTSAFVRQFKQQIAERRSLQGKRA